MLDKLSLMLLLHRSRILQFLGQYSMSLYLLHDPVIKYLIFQSQLDQESPVTLLAGGVTSLVLAVLITRILETPARQYCNYRRQLASNTFMS